MPVSVRPVESNKMHCQAFGSGSKTALAGRSLQWKHKTRTSRGRIAVCSHQNQLGPIGRGYSSHAEPVIISPSSSACDTHASSINAARVALASSLALAGAAAAASPAFADGMSAMNTITDISDLIIPGIVGDSPLREGIVSGFLLIFFSEIGDKTFFIALLLALRQAKGAVFAGTFGALAVMTVISVGLGQVLHQLDELVPQTPGAFKVPYDDLIAAALLVYFGIQTLKDAKDAAETAEEEKDEAQEVVNSFGADDTIKVILTTFALVFAAEWGDKSFLATIALAASSSPVGVVTGAIAGHGVATGLAVTGGAILSRYFSASLLQYFGGSLFLVFAAATVVDIFAQLNGK